MNIVLKKISKHIYLLPPFLLGIGHIKASISYFIIFSLFFYFSRNSDRIIKNVSGSIIGIFWIAYFISYYIFFIPPDLPWGRIPLDFYHYLQISLPILLIYFLNLSFKNVQMSIYILISIASGMMLLAFMNMLMTLIYLNPPYYGKAYHSISHTIYNSPGTTILGSMLPIVLISFWKKQQSIFNFYNVFLLVSVIISLAISIIFTARTPFFIIFFGIVIKMLICSKDIMNIIKRRRNSLMLLSIFAILFLISSFFLINSINKLTLRIYHGDYFIKIQHHLDYWNQIKTDFWIYPTANYVAKYEWFHNFFFDNHRTSGPITAIISYLIFLLTLIKSIFDIKANREFAKSIFLLLILYIPFLITTIPWESSESQMIALYAGIAGIVFRKKKKNYE